MSNALRSRWLLLLVGLGALPGCADLPGGPGYAPVRLDPGLAAERYLLPASDPDGVAQTHTLETVWTKMENGAPAAYTPASVAANREEPVIHSSNLQSSTVQPPPGPPASTSGATTRRSLYDKQPWEVELDNLVRAICRGC